MALAATVLPDCVYRVLAVVWIVTVLPLDVLATIVLPFTLDTVIASHGPCALGVAASDWSLLSPPCVTPCASMRAKAKPPIRSHLRPRRREGGGWPDRVETISS